MYAAIRRYRADDVDETLRRADEVYAAAVARQVGFCGYQIVRTGPHEVMSQLLFETRDEVDRNRSFTTQFTDIGFAGLDVELLDEWRGEVVVSCATEQLLSRLHHPGQTAIVL